MLICAACANVGDAPPHQGLERTTRFVYSPYKHVPIDAVSFRISTAASGAVTPIIVDGRSTLPAAIGALTLAFATGDCGSEMWDGVEAQRWAGANVAALNRAGIDYIVSTGGETASFTCSNDAGMQTFVERYMSPRLIGFDFDIERSQSEDVVASLVQRIANVQRKHPQLRFSFTLATWAGSDGDYASLNADGERVMRAIRDAGLDDYYVNLMVMDYGAATARNCVVAGDVCQMGLSAIQAVRNVHERHAVPLQRIEVTPMIGVNDVVANVFTLEDAKTVARFVRDNRLAGLHFWSLDRDTPCRADVSGVSSTCNGIAGATPFAYTAAFRDALR